jgi:hypothetical protein
MENPLRLSTMSLGFSGDKDIDVEGYGERHTADIETPRVDMASTGTHQDDCACHRQVENRPTMKPRHRGRADKVRNHHVNRRRSARVSDSKPRNMATARCPSATGSPPWSSAPLSASARNRPNT